MKKKVVDIFSPKKERKAPSRIKKAKVRISFPSAGKRSLLLGLGVLVLVFLFCFFTPPHLWGGAKIEIWPETETKTFKTKLAVGEDIPGTIFEKEKTLTENFPATGIVLKEGKAEGMIRVYNEYSTYSQALVATTRFVSAEGKLFRTPSRVTIPGGHYEKGKFVPGEIDIKVKADQAGPEYNIGPSTFSIPGFAGTARYTKFYAKSFQPMTGGYLQEVSQVTKKDLEGAENILTKKAKEESEIVLKNELQGEEISSEYNFLEKAIKTEVLETFSLARAGEEAEDFNFQVKAKSETLIFKKADLENFVKEFILSQIAANQKFYEKSLKINFAAETINLKAGKIILSLEISAKIYQDLDLSALKNGLRGKSSLETKVFLENQPEITKVTVEFWPFWVKSVPEDLEKIEIKLRVD